MENVITFVQNNPVILFALLLVGAEIYRRFVDWLRYRNTIDNGEFLDMLERYALIAVEFAEATALSHATETMRNKKEIAIGSLERDLQNVGIEADLDELDKAIEVAWFRTFHKD